LDVQLAACYAFVAWTLTRLGDRALDKPLKTLVKRYPAKTAATRVHSSRG